jgi:hypothetical protein
VEELSSGDTSFRQVLSVTFITLHRVLSGAFVYKVPALSRWIRNFVGRGPFYRDRSLNCSICRVCGGGIGWGYRPYVNCK